MNCTGDAATDYLLVQCFGSVAGQPAEVRAFRSHRPHSSRLCYGLVLGYPGLTAQTKACYSPLGQAEFRANFTHSRLLLLALGLPFNSSLRLLLRPGPQRWGLGFGLVAGPWKVDLGGRLRMEAVGLYGWHGLVEYGTPSITHKAETRGQVRVEHWCHLRADVNGVWDSVSSSLVVSARCGGLLRVAWVQVRERDGAVAGRTSLTIIGRADRDGLRGSVGLENHQDSLHCLLSLILKEERFKLGWTLQHHWASLSTTVPARVDLHGAAQLHLASLSGSFLVSLEDADLAQLDITVTWDPRPHITLRAIHQHSLTRLKDAGVPEGANLSVLVEPSQAQVELESENCSMLAHGTSLHGGGRDRRMWSLAFRQRCDLMKVREETWRTRGWDVPGPSDMFPSQRQ